MDGPLLSSSSGGFNLQLEPPNRGTRSLSANRTLKGQSHQETDASLIRALLSSSFRSEMIQKRTSSVFRNRSSYKGHEATQLDSSSSCCCDDSVAGLVVVQAAADLGSGMLASEPPSENDEGLQLQQQQPRSPALPADYGGLDTDLFGFGAIRRREIKVEAAAARAASDAPGGGSSNLGDNKCFEEDRFKGTGKNLRLRAPACQTGGNSCKYGCQMSNPQHQGCLHHQDQLDAIASSSRTIRRQILLTDPFGKKLKDLRTLRQHYYPEGGWGWVLVLVTLLVQALITGIQVGVAVFTISATYIRRGASPLMDDKNISNSTSGGGNGHWNPTGVGSNNINVSSFSLDQYGREGA